MAREHHARSGDGAYAIRPFSSVEEYRECVALQEATWGGGFSERVPPAILQVAQILGGVSAGAYDASGRLVGFVFGLTGVRDGEVVHWSDMLAVRPEARDAGLGRRLKEYQRDVMLDRGVETMFWTFDPLRARNAHLNVTRLGALVREYKTNMYGHTDSPLHRGLETDRLVALWPLASKRVRDRLAGARPTDFGEIPYALAAVADPRGDDRPGSSSGIPSYTASGAASGTSSGTSGGIHPRPGTPDLSLGEDPRNDALRVVIPSDIGSLMRADLGLAVEWRIATRAVFVHYLSLGYEVAEFERGRSTSSYVIVRRGDVER